MGREPVPIIIISIAVEWMNGEPLMGTGDVHYPAYRY
jgi:hypothetical protein